MKTLSPEQRRAVNLANASKSTGPKSDEGKARARYNALKHGLRAELLPLPGEGQAAAERAEAWNVYYQPASPAAQHLVNECARATLLSDRVHEQYHAAVSRQLRRAREDWVRAREDQVARFTRMLQTDPAAACTGLGRTPEGCEALLEHWKDLSESLDEFGSWAEDELNEAIRLLGFSDKADPSGRCRRAWTTRLMNALCTEPRPTFVINRLMAPAYAPASLRDVYGEHEPDADEARKSLKAMVDAECDRLRAERDRLRDAFDVADLEEATTRALTLTDPTQARLFLRYQAEARSAFHRNHAALLKALERDATADGEDPDEPGLDAPSFVSPNEPNLEAVPGPGCASVDCAPETHPTEEAASPNEPNLEAVPGPGCASVDCAPETRPTEEAASPNESPCPFGHPNE